MNGTTTDYDQAQAPMPIQIPTDCPSDPAPGSDEYLDTYGAISRQDLADMFEEEMDRLSKKT